MIDFTFQFRMCIVLFPLAFSPLFSTQLKHGNKKKQKNRKQKRCQRESIHCFVSKHVYWSFDQQKWKKNEKNERKRKKHTKRIFDDVADCVVDVLAKKHFYFLKIESGKKFCDSSLHVTFSFHPIFRQYIIEPFWRNFSV